MTTFAVFMVARKMDFGGWLHEKVVKPVSEASYGMYLLHMFILPSAFALLSPHLPAPLAILATAAATFVCSSLASLLLRRVPVVGRWICG